MWMIRRWPLSGAVLVRYLSFIVFLFFVLRFTHYVLHLNHYKELQRKGKCARGAIRVARPSAPPSRASGKAPAVPEARCDATKLHAFRSPKEHIVGNVGNVGNVGILTCHTPKRTTLFHNDHLARSRKLTEVSNRVEIHARCHKLP